VVDVIPELKGKISGLALRVPVQVVSITDLVVDVKRDVTAEEVNEAFKKAGIPAVLVDRQWKGDYTSYVGPENFKIGQQDGQYTSTGWVVRAPW
jgi:glyceraldehyde-3-phosphate dehydrogenase/erythrose-4-phosphate dehydrogenase